MQALEGKTVVVIGGTSGIGLSASRRFQKDGANLVVVGRNPKHVAEARDLLGSEARVLQEDALAAATPGRAIGLALELFHGFDGLYHVAGGSGRRWGDGPLHELPEQGWNATLELNLKSVFLSNRAAVRSFLERQHRGSILNCGSVLATSPCAEFFATHAYAAAKAGLIGLTRAAAAYYAGRGIRFNVLAPALVATRMSERAQRDASILEFIRSKQPLDGGRIGHPSDLDAAAVFFLSDASRFATGQVLEIDGGWSLSEGGGRGTAPPCESG